MKILFIGDIHGKINNFKTYVDFLTWVNSTVKDLRPDIVCNLGDTFDSHVVVRSEIMSEFVKHVKECIGYSSQYVYVLGNHDMYRPNDSTYHALSHMKGAIDRFKIVDSITDYNGITFVPYLYAHANFPKKTQPICVAHQTFIGADYGGYRPDDGVNADDVSADIVISGHIHKKQSFGKVIYPGSPFSQNYNDVDEEKGLMYFDTDTYEYITISSPLPMWKSLDIDLTNVNSSNISEMHSLIVGYLNHKDNWIIKLIGSKIDIANYADSEAFKKLKEDFKIKTRYEYVDKEKKAFAKIKLNSIEGIVSDYISNIYSGTVDKSILKNKFNDLLKK